MGEFLGAASVEMHHIFSVLCDSPVLDKRSGKLSVHGVVERVSLPDPKHEMRTLKMEDGAVAAIQLWLVSWVERSEGDTPETGELRFYYLSPGSKKKLYYGESTPVDLATNKRVRSLMFMGHIPLLGAGTYYVGVDARQEDSKRWRNVARLPIELQFLDSQDEFMNLLVHGSKPGPS